MMTTMATGPSLLWREWFFAASGSKKMVVVVVVVVLLHGSVPL